MSAPALVGLGVLVAGLHRAYDISMNLPGHHGLELLTAMLFARLVSRDRWAMLFLATGAAGGDLIFPADFIHNLKHVPLYYIMGGTLDLLYLLLGQRLGRLPFAAAAGALVQLTRPLAMMAVAAATGSAFGFMRHGELFPLVTHASFGAIGAICGALLARPVLSGMGTSVPRARAPGSPPPGT